MGTTDGCIVQLHIIFNTNYKTIKSQQTERFINTSLLVITYSTIVSNLTYIKYIFKVPLCM